MSQLVEKLLSVRADLENSARVVLADPCIVVELRALCDRVGYGNVMSSASVLWRQTLGDLAGGEFVSGPCRTTVENDIAIIDQAATAITDLEALVGELGEALSRQGDNMAFVLNRVTLPYQWYEKFTTELEQDRATLAKLEKARG